MQVCVCLGMNSCMLYLSEIRFDILISVSSLLFNTKLTELFHKRMNLERWENLSILHDDNHVAHVDMLKRKGTFCIHELPFLAMREVATFMRLFMDANMRRKRMREGEKERERDEVRKLI